MQNAANVEMMVMGDNKIYSDCQSMTSDICDANFLIDGGTLVTDRLLKKMFDKRFHKMYAIGTALGGGKSGAYIFTGTDQKNGVPVIIKAYKTAMNDFHDVSDIRPFRDVYTQCKLNGEAGFPTLLDYGVISYDDFNYISKNQTLFKKTRTPNSLDGNGKESKLPVFISSPPSHFLFMITTRLMSPWIPLLKLDLRQNHDSLIGAVLQIASVYQRAKTKLGPEFQHWDFHADNIFVNMNEVVRPTVEFSKRRRIKKLWDAAKRNVDNMCKILFISDEVANLAHTGFKKAMMDMTGGFAVSDATNIIDMVMLGLDWATTDEKIVQFKLKVSNAFVQAFSINVQNPKYENFLKSCFNSIIKTTGDTLALKLVAMYVGPTLRIRYPRISIIDFDLASSSRFGGVLPEHIAKESSVFPITERALSFLLRWLPLDCAFEWLLMMAFLTKIKLFSLDNAHIFTYFITALTYYRLDTAEGSQYGTEPVREIFNESIHQFMRTITQELTNIATGQVAFVVTRFMESIVHNANFQSSVETVQFFPSKLKSYIMSMNAGVGLMMPDLLKASLSAYLNMSPLNILNKLEFGRTGMSTLVQEGKDAMMLYVANTLNIPIDLRGISRISTLIDSLWWKVYKMQKYYPTQDTLILGATASKMGAVLHMSNSDGWQKAVEMVSWFIMETFGHDLEPPFKPEDIGTEFAMIEGSHLMKLRKGRNHISAIQKIINKAMNTKEPPNPNIDFYTLEKEWSRYSANSAGDTRTDKRVKWYRLVEIITSTGDDPVPIGICRVRVQMAQETIPKAQDKPNSVELITLDLPLRRVSKSLKEVSGWNVGMDCTDNLMKGGIWCGVSSLITSFLDSTTMIHRTDYELTKSILDRLIPFVFDKFTTINTISIDGDGMECSARLEGGTDGVITISNFSFGVFAATPYLPHIRTFHLLNKLLPENDKPLFKVTIDTIQIKLEDGAVKVNTTFTDDSSKMDPVFEGMFKPLKFMGLIFISVIGLIVELFSLLLYNRPQYKEFRKVISSFFYDSYNDTSSIALGLVKSIILYYASRQSLTSSDVMTNDLWTVKKKNNSYTVSVIFPSGEPTGPFTCLPWVLAGDNNVGYALDCMSFMNPADNPIPKPIVEFLKMFLTKDGYTIFDPKCGVFGEWMISLNTTIENSHNVDNIAKRSVGGVDVVGVDVCKYQTKTQSIEISQPDDAYVIEMLRHSLADITKHSFHSFTKNHRILRFMTKYLGEADLQGYSISSMIADHKITRKIFESSRQLNVMGDNITDYINEQKNELASMSVKMLSRKLMGLNQHVGNDLAPIKKAWRYLNSENLVKYKGLSIEFKEDYMLLAKQLRNVIPKRSTTLTSNDTPEISVDDKPFVYKIGTSVDGHTTTEAEKELEEADAEAEAEGSRSHPKRRQSAEPEEVLEVRQEAEGSRSRPKRRRNTTR